MTEDEKPTAELAQVESFAATEGMRYVFIDKELDKRVVRKLDFHIMPILMALCKLIPSLIANSELTAKTDLCSILDRGNIGNAQTAGLSKSLNMSDAQYQWLLKIFYIPYVVFEWLALMVYLLFKF
jgi:hypothetical protein